MFITFEGVDGCGKSTQIKKLSDKLTELNIEHIVIREPGSTSIGEQIREILLSKENVGMSALTEAYLYASARLQLISEVIEPALKSGKTVICDRYIDSNIAYQAFGRNLGVETVLQINDYAIKHCMPDISIFLDVPPKDANERMKNRSDADRLELEGMDFKQRVYLGYKWCVENFGRMYDVDASGTIEETAAAIYNIVKKHLK